MKTSPSQVNTCTVRVSHQARALLLTLAINNNTSVADELDKKLGIERKVE
jgi:hypothetical protein